MSQRLRTAVSTLALVLIAGAMLSWAQSPQERLRIEGRLRSPQASERASALRELKQYPTQESARTILQAWSKDRDTDVRTAAAVVLYGLRTDAKLRPMFLAALKQEPNAANAILVGVLLAGGPAGEHTEVLDLLGRAFEKRPAGAQILIPVTEFLGTRDDADAVQALSTLTRLGAYRNHFGFRRAVVQSLIAMRRPDAVSTLVDLLAASDGEIQGDIVQQLTYLSGERHGTDANAWKNWWAAKQNGFAFPAPGQKARQLLVNGVPTYYGIPIFAKKVIFVIDTSGSMREDQRIDNAKIELKKVIELLPSTTEFNILSFNSTLSPWSRSMMQAAGDAKSRATAWVQRLNAAGGTHTYDAMRAALDQQPEAIYLLTDGKPEGGSIVKPQDILDAIREPNKYRRTTIHVIGLNPGPEDGIFSKFLKELAAQNFGAYRRVD